VCGFCVGGCVSRKQVKKEYKRAEKRVSKEARRAEKKISAETSRWAEDTKAVVKTLTGEMARDKERLQKQQEIANDIRTEYQGAIDGLADNYKLKGQNLMFLPEIFAMAIANMYDSSIEDLELTMGAEYAAQVAKVKKMQKDFNNEYDFVLNLAGGSFVEKLLGSAIMIVGGMMKDTTDIVTGKANSGTYMRILAIVVKVIIIVLLALTGNWVAAAIVLADLIITLDGWYADGTMLGAIFSLLDFVFNDVLNLDDRIGSDFDDFDRDSEGYAAMQAKFKVALSIAAAIASWNAGGDMAAYIDTLATAQTVNTIGTLSTYYAAYQMAMTLKDLHAQNEAYNNLKDELNNKKQQIDDSINKQINHKMIASYRDASKIQTDTDELINMYTLQIANNSSEVETGEHRVPMNTRYEVADNDMSFGFEGVLDTTKYGGDPDYNKNILIKSAFGIG